MIVWRDTSGAHKHRKPEWLDGLDVSARSSEHGTLLCLPKFAMACDFRPSADWYEVGDGWSAAMYDAERFRPADYARDRIAWLAIEVMDVTGYTWAVPAMLRPDGLPAIGMRHRAVNGTDGAIVIEREPATKALAAALSAAESARAELLNDESEATDADYFGWIATVLAAGYHLDVSTLGRLALIGDALREKGLRLAGGLIKEDDDIGP